MKCFKVYCEDYYPGSIWYYNALTASKARYLAFLHIVENHPKVKFGQIRVLREPQFDKFIRPNLMLNGRQDENR